MKCNNCKFYNNKYCIYFRQHIKAKKSCWAHEEKIESAVKNSFKFLEK